MPAGQQISLPVVVRGGRWCFGWDRGLCVRPGLWGLKGRQQAVWRGINKQLSSQERSLRGPSSSSCPPGLPPTLLRATCTDNCPQLPGIQLHLLHPLLLLLHPLDLLIRPISTSAPETGGSRCEAPSASHQKMVSPANPEKMKRLIYFVSEDVAARCCLADTYVHCPMSLLQIKTL